MRRPLNACLAVVALACLACVGSRDAGPHEDEAGQVLFWEVTDMQSDSSGCTDASDFDDALALPPLEPNTFFMVRIADNGRTATAVDCTETRASTCADIDGFDFSIDGHVLEHVDEPLVVDSAAGCDVSLLATWTMVDDGDSGGLEVGLTFPFDGEPADCDALEEAIVASGSNGDGLRDCRATLTADLEFVRAD